MARQTWTITFGECVENHAGMVRHGVKSDRGFTFEEVVTAGHLAQAKGHTVEFYDLLTLLPNELQALLPEAERKSACVVVIRQGARLFFHPDDYEGFVAETKATQEIVDKKAKMRGRVVNKHARWNLCYADTHQEPQIEDGKGTIVAFSEVRYLNQIRNYLPNLLGDAAKSLFAELNYYYNLDECGIGYHGDSERRFIVALRVGDMLPLHYQWYHQGNPVGSNLKLEINGGDVYIMAEKAVGTDWKKRVIPTLRHAAGFNPKFVLPK